MTTEQGRDPSGQALVSDGAATHLHPSGFDPSRWFNERERRTIGAMLSLKEQASGPSCAPLGDWLVGAAKRTWPRFAGLTFWKRTNSKRTWTLVSYHHPARLCWSWSLWIAFFRNTGGTGLSRIWRSYGGDWHLCIPFVVDLSWHRQNYDWMLSITAQQRLEKVALYVPRSEPEVLWSENA